MEMKSWTPCGTVTLCEEGRPKFPKVPTVAGIYRLILNNGWCYIGESQDLSKRLSEYRRLPKAGIVQEHRLHHALKESGGAAVEVMTGEYLNEKTTRTVVEADLIRAARLEGKKLLNGGGEDQRYCLLLDIKFHQSEIEKLNHKLNALSPEKE
jgi:predicted GIY-YIG superfamily endonuclease